MIFNANVKPFDCIPTLSLFASQIENNSKFPYSSSLTFGKQHLPSIGEFNIGAKSSSFSFV